MLKCFKVQYIPRNTTKETMLCFTYLTLSCSAKTPDTTVLFQHENQNVKLDTGEVTSLFSLPKLSKPENATSINTDKFRLFPF